MTGRERIQLALDHKEADRIPLDLGVGVACMFTKGFYVKLLDYFGLRQKHVFVGDPQTQSVVASEKLLKILGSDDRMGILSIVPHNRPCARKWEDENSWYMTDNWGITFRMPKNQGWYFDLYEYPLRGATEEADAGYQWPYSNPTILPDTALRLKALRDKGYWVAVGQVYGNGFLQMGPRLYTHEDWFTMLLTEEPRVRRFLDQFLEKKLEWYAKVFKAGKGYVDMVCECDDLGTQISPFISPELFRSLILPYHRQLWAGIKKMSPNTKIFLHSCGCVEPFIGDLIDAGLDILNPIQITAARMDPYDLKRKYGKDITFWGGGVNTQQVLPRGSKQEIIDDVKRNIDALADGGGFVFSTVHNVQPDVPVENFITMWEAFQKYSKY